MSIDLIYSSVYRQNIQLLSFYKIENTQEQLENTMTPGGYITEAFEQVHREMEELTGEIRQMNGKIDIILRHITGQGNS